jgi:hypothetical protein
MKITRTIMLAFVAAICAVGCAELDESGSGIGIHPPDWSKVGSPNNHAMALAAAGLPNSVEDCSGCHGEEYGWPDEQCFACHARENSQGHSVVGYPPSGADFHGEAVIDAGGVTGCGNCHAWSVDGELDFTQGGWSKIGCNGCHAGGVSGHPGSNRWLNPSSPGFHGEAVKGEEAPDCNACHGADYRGGWAEVSCFTCHAGGPSGHPASSEWLNPSSPEFHGQAAAGPAITGCADCHGADYLGGWTGVSCNLCHPNSDIHPVGWVETTDTPGSHGYYLDMELMTTDDCRACHGEDFTGGWSGEDCSPCH